MAKARLRSPSGSLRLALLMLPALLLFLLFFGIPIVRLLVLGFENGFGHYEKALTGEVYQKIFLLTFKVSLLVTAITFVLGYPVAYWLSTTTPRWRAIGFALILLPFWRSVSSEPMRGWCCSAAAA